MNAIEVRITRKGYGVEIGNVLTDIFEQSKDPDADFARVSVSKEIRAEMIELLESLGYLVDQGGSTLEVYWSKEDWDKCAPEEAMRAYQV